MSLYYLLPTVHVQISSLTEAESNPALWVETLKFDNMTIKENKYSIQKHTRDPRVYDIPSNGILTNIIIPGMNFPPFDQGSKSNQKAVNYTLTGMLSLH